ncbi:hypothetical protein [Streptacidiphilus sp. P02-A3a]|uniref:hypothetical protein n=1 Tax=Streptacidiphilus sp. P02-A3a TaxID=2704468 RepID=UPI0015FDB477|nr:hypothetical protein [Streptacidiphilus sp. P02-A3a]QMU70270.1 hypothetical protein GXP74_20685 [Streptacidiphilus sp. P02-A3a]
MAHPAFALALPVRAWRVDLAPDRPRWTCSAAGCPGAERGRRQTAQVALGHLGQHAAAEPLPAYLRTCRCHAHGCAWHPRHRGCQGLVALTVFRSRGGATWQLADACSACARAIPHAAQLPPAPRARVAAQPRPPPPRHPVPRGAASLQPLLTYLDAALLPGTPARVRLVALLCLLRADRNGTVRLPQGFCAPGGWPMARTAWWPTWSASAGCTPSPPTGGPWR